MAHAAQAALADGSSGDILAAQGQHAGLDGLQTGQTVDQLCLAVAVDTGDAHDLAAADLEGDIFHRVFLAALGADTKLLRLQDHIGGLGSFLIHDEFHIAAHHHPGQLVHGGFSGIHRADILTLAQHGAAVRDRHDLIELVGDEQDEIGRAHV